MKKIIILFMILFIATGCQYMGPEKKEDIKVPDIHTGTHGITLSFLENAPPADVYEESPFDIIVKVHNQGAVDVMSGILILSVEEQNVALSGERDARIDLNGKSVFNPEGAFELKQFRARAKQLGTLVAQSYKTTMTATACYPYKTAATALMCIDTDILNQVKNKPCIPKTQSFSSGQGAPISIKTVVPKMMPHEDPEYITPEFKITINNQGGGSVMSSERFYEACTGQPVGREHWNAVKVRASISDQYLECLPNLVKLKTGDTTFVCSLPGGIDRALGTYTAPLSIELDYGYMIRAIDTMEIVKPPV